MMKQIIITALIVSLPFLSNAQTFNEWVGNGWGIGLDECNPAITDLDSDGLLDLIIGAYQGDIHHYEQTAVNANSFSLVKYHFNKIDVGLYAAPAIADIDNDDLLDLIIGNSDGNLHHYEQVSANADSFQLISDNFSTISVEKNASPCFSDLDADGLLDLLIGAHSGKISLYEQESNDSDLFILITDSINVKYYLRNNPTVTDLDQDGLLDLIIGGNRAQLLHYEQNSIGSMEFVFQSDILFDLDDYIYGGSCPCFVDFDDDGLLDLLVGEMDGLYYHFEQETANSSNFVVQSNNILGLMDVGSGAFPCVVDLDNDGLLDLIVGEWHGNLNHFEQTAVGSLDFIHVSDTLGRFDVGDYSSPALTDIDGDGLIDLVVGEREGTLNHFEQDPVNPNAFNLVAEYYNEVDFERYSTPCFTDLDGDNLIDMILGENSGKLYLYEQQDVGSTAFNLVNDSLNVLSEEYRPAPFVVDYDSDGLFDLLVGRDNGMIYHYEQKEINSTEFLLITDKFENLDVGNDARISIADIDADGWIDLIIGESNGGLCLFLNQTGAEIRLPQIGDQKPILFHLDVNYPNPFNPTTTIEYTVPKKSFVEICIIDLLGREVKTLISGDHNAGRHHVTWNGLDNTGSPVASGVYFFQMTAEGFTETRKLLLIK